MGSVSRIDIDGLAELIGHLEAAESTLDETSQDYLGRTNQMHVTSYQPGRIGTTASNIGRALPDLNRRLDLANALAASSPDGISRSVVSITEPVLDAAEAAEIGEGFADGLSEPPTAEELAWLADELGPYLYDPEVMSAFWGGLGPEYAELLPLYIAEIADNPAEIFETVSISFGTALHDRSPGAELTALIEAFTEPLEPGHFGQGWPRMALLAHANPPSDVLTQIALANGMDPFLDYTGEYDGRYSGPVPEALGLPSNTLELMFDILARDPEAARAVIGTRGATEENVQILLEYGAVTGDSNGMMTSLGLALEAGSEAHATGERSRDAEVFAFGLIQGAAHVGIDTPWNAQESLGIIAAAYVDELLAGSILSDAADRESSLLQPSGMSAIHGLDPAFFLSPDDVRNFFAAFGQSDDFALPFDLAAGQLYEDLLTEALTYDLEHGTNTYLDTTTAFGNLAGLQYFGQRDAREVLDEAQEQLTEYFGFVANQFTSRIPAPTDQALALMWKAGKWVAGELKDEWVELNPQATHVGDLTDEAIQALLLQDVGFTRILLSVDPTRGESLPDSLMADDGQLLSALEIGQDEDLINEYLSWLDGQDIDFDDHATDTLVDRYRTMYLGGFQEAQSRYGEL